MSTAFDTLLHDILLEKMSYYGVNGVANDLLQSYLTQRKQIVDLEGFLSKSVEIIRFIYNNIYLKSILKKNNRNWCRIWDHFLLLYTLMIYQ